MGKYACVILDQARKWLGKNEKDGSHKEIIDCYNSQKVLPRNYKVQYNDEWCATFVSAVALKVGYQDIIPPECGCERMIELFRKLGCFIEDENYVPEPGTIIFYDWSDSGIGNCMGWADHVGIVEKVKGTTMTIIEGNMDSSVKRRTKTVNTKYIRGYAVPKYDKEKAEEVPSCITEMARMVIDGKFGVMPQRKDNIYNAIQKEVNRLLAK